jgi:NitT/TauT family transport system substrate-binding protein
MVANLKGVRQYNQGKTERNLDILVRHSGLERELLKRLAWPALRNDGMLNVDNVMMFQRWAQKRGMLDRCLDPGEFWDRSFVQYAAAELESRSRFQGRSR